MTFEAFFLKKKIDLDLLKAGKPELFSEFVSHFEQMNEKSFDHTKKYWFNNLRISYPLSEEKELQIKEAIKAAQLPPTDTAQVESLTEKPIQKASGFTPRFKAKQAVPAQTIEKASTEVEANAASLEKPATAKPAGFKPRFKAGVTKPTETEVSSEIENSEKGEEKPVASKPNGFKPRFKAGVTKPAETKAKPEIDDSEKTEEKAEVSKPVGFKPRFKAPKKED